MGWRKSFSFVFSCKLLKHINSTILMSKWKTEFLWKAWEYAICKSLNKWEEDLSTWLPPAIILSSRHPFFMRREQETRGRGIQIHSQSNKKTFFNFDKTHKLSPRRRKTFNHLPHGKVYWSHSFNMKVLYIVTSKAQLFGNSNFWHKINFIIWHIDNWHTCWRITSSGRSSH